MNPLIHLQSSVKICPDPLKRKEFGVFCNVQRNEDKVQTSTMQCGVVCYPLFQAIAQKTVILKTGHTLR